MASWQELELEESNPHQYPGKCFSLRISQGSCAFQAKDQECCGDGFKCQFVCTGGRKIAVLWSSSQHQAGGLYPAHHFGATRPNVADCSTRDTPFPALLASFVSALESFPDVLDFAGLGSLNRHSANWVKWVSLFVDFPPCVLGLAYPFWTLDFGLSSSVRALSVGFASAVTVVRSFPSRFCLGFVPGLLVGLGLLPLAQLDQTISPSSPAR